VLAVCACNRLCTAVRTELGQYVVDVGRDRLRADDEAQRDLALIEALGKKRQNLVLPWCQARSTVGPPAAEQAPNPDQQLVQSERLDEVVVRADQQTGHPVTRLGSLAGDEDDREPRPELLTQLPAYLVTREVWQDDLDDG